MATAEAAWLTSATARVNMRACRTAQTNGRLLAAPCALPVLSICRGPVPRLAAHYRMKRFSVSVI
jgi:hypothetical protein